MGFLKNMFENLEEELSSSQKKSGKASRRASGPPPTRWEKAVIALSSVTTQVVKVDPDGVDIVCFGGDEDADWYRNVKHTKHLEEMVSDKRPKGVSISVLVQYYCCLISDRFSFVYIHLCMTRLVFFRRRRRRRRQYKPFLLYCFPLIHTITYHIYQYIYLYPCRPVPWVPR